MAIGADSIVKLILTVLFVLILVAVAGVFAMLVEPILDGVIDTGLMSDLGWGVPFDVLVLFAGIAMLALGVVVVLWWIVSPIRDDVRQEQVRRGGF